MITDPSGADPVLQLHTLHTQLSDVFVRFQEHLLGLELADAKLELEAYRQRLQAHLELEAAELLPLYRTRVPEAPRGGTPSLFDSEHQKLTLQLEALSRALDRFILLQQQGDAQLRRQVLAGLERSFRIAQVAEHHHLREEQVLIPALVEVLGRSEVAVLLTRIFSPAQR